MPISPETYLYSPSQHNKKIAKYILVSNFYYFPYENLKFVTNRRILLIEIHISRASCLAFPVFVTCWLGKSTNTYHYVISASDLARCRDHLRIGTAVRSDVTVSSDANIE